MKSPISALIVTLFFGLSYFLLFQFQVQVMGTFDFLPMVSILFVPAGMKFLGMLIGRGWGVLGIFIGRLALDLQVGNSIQSVWWLLNNVFWLVLPYMFINHYLQRQRLSDDLSRLSAYHLAVLAIGASLISSVGSQVLVFIEHQPVYSFMQATWSMVIGDVSGIMATLLFVYGARRAFRH